LSLGCRACTHGYHPRFDLDICIFRAYENGQPAKIDNYLKFNPNGPSDGELTFVSGHPAKTDRQFTVDELADMRDRELPRFLSFFKRREILLHSFGERSFGKSAARSGRLFWRDEQSKAL
jgi:hypothetical protein